MRKKSLLAILVCFVFTFGIFFNSVFSQTKVKPENSNPYIELSVKKQTVEEGEEFIYKLIYGNKGPEPAKNVRIIFNQPLEGRAPLTFITSKPEPNNWINSEQGSLAEFIIGTLDTYEATEEGSIALKVKVRDSVSPQTLSTTASLQAPNRDVGKRLIVTDAVNIKISGTEEESPETSSVFNENQPLEEIQDISKLKSSFSDQSQVDDSSVEEKSELVTYLLSSDSLWTVGGFLVVSLFLVLSFISGRKSVRY